MGKKKTFEVKVTFEGIEYYSVRAESEEEALAHWAEGDLVGSDGHSYGAVSATEDTFADDED